jgi:hypothetical protein
MKSEKPSDKPLKFEFQIKTDQKPLGFLYFLQNSKFEFCTKNRPFFWFSWFSVELVRSSFGSYMDFPPILAFFKRIFEK